MKALWFVAAGTLLLAACGADADVGTRSPAGDPEAADAESAGTDAPDDVAEADRPVTVPQIESSPPTVTVSGLGVAYGQVPLGDAPEPLVDLDEIRSGGPPPDGIPPIDEPTFLRPDDVDFLADQEPVLAIEIDGDARAYPIQILMWHEIVNDTIADIPVTVTYCPLCNSALAYDRRVDERIVDFGTSGLLWNSALVMYDRQTETLWSHFTAEGLVGELTGVELDTYPLATVPWEVWRDAHPDGLVLSRDTGFSRDYGRNPYVRYDDLDGRPFAYQGEVDGRYTAMTRVVGVDLDGEAVAVPLISLVDDGVLAAEIAGTDVVFLWQPGTSSALDAAQIVEGDDIGATGVFEATLDGEVLDFTATADGFVDSQTGTTWNLLGHAIDGELAGDQLTPIEHVDTFWFAWGAFRPDTMVITE